MSFERKQRATAIRAIICVNTAAAALLAAALLVYPSARAGLDMRDAALKSPGAPQFDWRLMRHLTPRYAACAAERVVPARGFQVILWVALILGAIAAIWLNRYLISLALWLIALLLPRVKKSIPDDDWTETDADRLQKRGHA